MAHHDIFYTLPAGDRTYKRYQLVSLFLQEEPGEGKGTLASTYTYTVESWGRYTICLCRPANLNHGFDFIVNIPIAYFQHDRNRNPNAPSHDDAVFCLKNCAERYPAAYPFIRNALRSIYNCQEPDLSHIQAGFFDFNGIDHPIQILLLAIKWLFMEQDCTYWNYSGRQMLFNKLYQNGLI